MGCFLLLSKRDFEQIKARMGRAPTLPEQIVIGAASLTSVSPPAAIAWMKWATGAAVGLLNYGVGKAGEQIAGRVLEQVAEQVLPSGKSLKVVEYTRAQGVDVRMKGTAGEVVVEVKTSARVVKSFDEMLGTGYGYKQCSDDWFRCVGVDDPSRVQVMGVHIDPIQETVTVYQREDGSGSQWRKVIEGAPLSRFNLGTAG